MDFTGTGVPHIISCHKNLRVLLYKTVEILLESQANICISNSKGSHEQLNQSD